MKKLISILLVVAMLFSMSSEALAAEGVQAEPELLEEYTISTGTYYTYFQSMVIACAIYLTMTVISSRLLRLLEKRIDGADNYDLSTTDTLAHTSGMNTAPTKHL